MSKDQDIKLEITLKTRVQSMREPIREFSVEITSDVYGWHSLALSDMGYFATPIEERFTHEEMKNVFDMTIKNILESAIERAKANVQKEFNTVLATYDVKELEQARIELNEAKFSKAKRHNLL